VSFRFCGKHSIYLIPIVHFGESVIRFVTPIICIRDFYCSNRNFHENVYSEQSCFVNYNTSSKTVKSLKEIAFNSCFDIECVNNNLNPLSYTYQPFQYACAYNPQVFLQNIPNGRGCCSVACVISMDEVQSLYSNNFTLTNFTLCFRCAAAGAADCDSYNGSAKHVYYEHIYFPDIDECIQYIKTKKQKKHLWCKKCFKCTFQLHQKLNENYKCKINIESERYVYIHLKSDTYNHKYYLKSMCPLMRMPFGIIT
jgi:hypothetical protein